MLKSRIGLHFCAAGLLLLAACSMTSKYPAVGPEADDWAGVGRTLQEQRYTPLNEVNEDNVDKLGLAWTFKIDDDRGMEATPVVIGGVMYVTGPWSKVYAIDATNGKALWKFDPEVDRGTANRTCCDVINRGVAVSNGKVYVGTLDGRLIALDAKTGAVKWSADTLIDKGRSYAITGAPRLAAGNVVIGNGGAEFGVRGYISAYDETSGKLSWRFYTVPGAEEPAADDKAMQIAKPTWFGNRYAEFGGGGTVWDSVAYDPDLNLLYVGVGNGSPHSRKLRSEGKGDNLFLSSIVAVDAKTGKYVWHFQTSPGDEWDFTATQNMILADMKIDGKDRKVLMQAPKNGYFYTIDRVTGKFISGNNFVPVNWSKGLDKNGRPLIDEEAARYEDGKLKLVTPSIYGAHGWQPMSYSPQTGLVYIPANITAWYFQQVDAMDYPKSGVFGAYKFGYIGAAGDPNQVGAAPPKAADIPNLALAADEKRLRESWTGKLIAWDPIKQKAVWTQDHITISNGGTLATGGNLVFQGTADGRFVAYRATDGKKLWDSPATTGVLAGPMSYRIKGEQYVAVAAGWGGAFPLFSGVLSNISGVHPDARIMVYKLGGTAKLPPRKTVVKKDVIPLLDTIDPVKVKAGYLEFAVNCSACHGLEAVSGGIVPDLRKMDANTVQNFKTILHGAYSTVGMPNFSGRLTDQQIDQILHYLAQRNSDLRSIQDQISKAPK